MIDYFISASVEMWIETFKFGEHLCRVVIRKMLFILLPRLCSGIEHRVENQANTAECLSKVFLLLISRKKSVSVCLANFHQFKCGFNFSPCSIFLETLFCAIPQSRKVLARSRDSFCSSVGNRISNPCISPAALNLWIKICAGSRNISMEAVA